MSEFKKAAVELAIKKMFNMDYFDRYVPDIVPNDYGDYVVLSINENGVITNWDSGAGLDDFFQDD